MQLVEAVLQPCRDYMGIPIRVNSGYRCPALNTLVGGSKTSDHLRGCAADISCTDNKKLLDYLTGPYVDFDQLIIYGSLYRPRFLHVSYRSLSENRHQVLYSD